MVEEDFSVNAWIYFFLCLLSKEVYIGYNYHFTLNIKIAQTGGMMHCSSDNRIIYLFIYSLKAYNPRQPHRVTSGFFKNSNLTQVEYNTKQAHFTNVKHINMIRKLVPLSLKKKANKVRRCWYH